VYVCVKIHPRNRPSLCINAMLSHACMHAGALPACPHHHHHHPNRNAPLVPRSFVVLLLGLTRRRYRTAHIYASIRVLCLLLGWFQNLPEMGAINALLDVNRKNITAYLERTQQCLIHTHHRTRVVKLSAVIWRRK